MVVEILALVMTDIGEAREAMLVSAEEGDVVDRGVSVTFGLPSGLYRLKAFNSENDLHAFLTARRLVHVVHRVRSPRIRFWHMMFWPPSQRVAEVIATQMRLFDEGQIPDPRPFSFEQIEGSDLSAAWEPIAEDYMAGLAGQEEGKLWGSA